MMKKGNEYEYHPPFILGEVYNKGEKVRHKSVHNQVGGFNLLYVAKRKGAVAIPTKDNNEDWEYINED